jgi:hypothetical protein
MSFSINEFASLFSIFAVLIALITLISENRRGRLSLQADLLLRLEDKFHSAEAKSLRREAAKKLLKNKRPNRELEEVFELLSTITFFYDIKCLDANIVYKQFAYWIDRYWLIGRKYIEEECRKYDPNNFGTLEKVAMIFIKKELKKGYSLDNIELLNSFLEEEKELL